MLSIRLAATVALLIFANGVAAQRPRDPDAAAQRSLRPVAAPLMQIAAAPVADSGKAGQTGKKAIKPRSGKQARVLRGEASWYGAKFAGKKTASGQRFSPKAMTAAHPNLPFGTKVRVTNLDTDQSVVLTINDRLPRKSGRLIDVTRAAADKLGFVEDGTTPVRVDVLRRPAM